MQRALFLISCHLILTALFALLAVARCLGQSTDSGTQRLQSEKDRAQLEADIAKAEKDKAEAEAAAFKARLGSISTSNLPQGTVKTDNVVIEGSYLAYLAADSAARIIAKHIPCGSNMIFFSATDLNSIQALDALKAQIALISSGKAKLVEPLQLKRASAAVLPEPTGDLKRLYSFQPAQQPEFAPAAIFAGIDAGLSVLSLFKTDTEFHGVSVTADDLALQALVTKHWLEMCPKPSRGDKEKAISPGYSYPPIETDLANNELLKSVSTLSTDLSEVSIVSQNLMDKVQTPLAKAVDALRKLIGDYRDTSALIIALDVKLRAASSREVKKKIQADLDSAKNHLVELTETVRSQYDTTQKLPPPGRKPYSEQELSSFLEAYLSDQVRADVRVQALKMLQSKMSDFSIALTKPDSNGTTPLVALLRAQALKKAKTESANIVNVKFITAGGNNIIKRSVFGSRLRFSGGVVAEYLLVDKSGYITGSGVVACYGGQLGEDDISKGFKKKKSGASCTEAVP